MHKHVVRDLLTIITIVDSLVDFKFVNTSPSKSKKLNDGKKKTISSVMVGRRITSRTKQNKEICIKERKVWGASSAMDHIG